MQTACQPWQSPSPNGLCSGVMESARHAPASAGVTRKVTTLTTATSLLMPGNHRSFSSLHAASAFMAAQIDRPVATQTARVGRGIELRTWAHALNDTAFCNVHEVTWHPGAAGARLHIRSCPVDVQADGQAAGALVIASAGFFVLADRCSALPRQVSLNLAISGGRIVSLPVTDREAVLCCRGTLSAGYVRAQGLLVLDGTRLTWTGSRTGRAADCYVYGNANTVIYHHDDPVTGAARMLDEASRLTPPMPPGGTMTDIGFMCVDDGGFRAVTASGTGQVDIFRHDLVLRCPARFAGPGRSSSRVDVLQIDWLGRADLPDSAVSAGPSLDCPDFTAHPVNHDRSLGSRPPFTARRIARMVLYADPQNRMHLRLFDGRPQSPVFPGVTPSEARDAIAADTGYRWGCFLDPGQTAKLWVGGDDGVTGHGNRHYLRWPDNPAGTFAWIPDQGRPVSSFITMQELAAAHRMPVRAAQ